MTEVYDIEKLPRVYPARGGWWPGEKPGTPTAAERINKRESSSSHYPANPDSD